MHRQRRQRRCSVELFGLALAGLESEGNEGIAAYCRPPNSSADGIAVALAVFDVCAEAASLKTDAGLVATGAGGRTLTSFGAVTTIGANTCGVGTTSAAEGALGIELGDVLAVAVTVARDTSVGVASAALPRDAFPAVPAISVRLPSIDTTTNTRLATAATSAISRTVSHGRVRGGWGATEVETDTAGGADRKGGG
jgi:hypothetical protein